MHCSHNLDDNHTEDAKDVDNGGRVLQGAARRARLRQTDRQRAH